MKITKFKKMSGNRYKVFLDNNDIIILNENVILDYNLLITKEINDNYEEIKKANNKYYIYDMILKYISKKMRCESEIRKYLKDKNIDEELCNQIIVKLRNNNLLDDRNYIKSYISDKVRLNNLGLNKIKKELIKLNLDSKIINEEISLYSKDDLLLNLEKLIDKKLCVNKPAVLFGDVEILYFNQHQSKMSEQFLIKKQYILWE